MFCATRGTLRAPGQNDATVRRSVVRVLMLCDRRPDLSGLGGTQVHAAALVREAGASVAISAAYPQLNKLVVLKSGSTVDPIAELPIGEPPSDPLSAWPGLTRALEVSLLSLGADVFSVQAPQLAPLSICEAIDRSAARVAVTLHDHALVCENPQLLEAGARFCDLPADIGRCDRCLFHTRKRTPGYVERWRNQQAALLERTDVVVAPSDSVLATVARIHPSIRARACRLDWGVPRPGARCDPRAAHQSPLRIAIVGVLAREKGAERLPELLAACRGLDVEWHLFGATEGRSLRAIKSAAPRVVAHGAYPRSKLAERMVSARCALGLLPSIVPESFSLVLSELWAAALPAIVSDFGAQKARVLAEDLGWVVNPWQPQALADLLRTLIADRSAIEERIRRLRERPTRDEAAMLRDHVRLWLELVDRGPRRTLPEGAEAEAAREFSAGAPRPTNAWLRALGLRADALRKTEWYRDLPLRRLLPEAARARVERGLQRVMRKKGR
jgi:glycosyltransferase involved in cell wall biosynthesis